MAAVASPVVQQDNVSLVLLRIRENALYDGIDRWRAAVQFAPIVRINPRAHDDVAHGLRNRQHLDLAGRFRLVVDSIRRAEEQGLDAETAFQEQLGKIQLELNLCFRNGFELRMCEGMVRDLMAFLVFAFDQGGSLIRRLTNHEEGGWRLL